MKPLRIAFTGQMRSGKDTCGEYVIRIYGGVIKKFATPLYDILAFAQQRCHLPQSKDRFFLQQIGTEWMRNTIDPNRWVSILIEEIAELSPDTNVVVTDARFVNEFETLKKNGFLLVKIERPDSERSAAEAGGITQLAAAHASEQDTLTYDGFDLTIYNGGTLEELYSTVDLTIGQYFHTRKLAERTPLRSPQDAEDLIHMLLNGAHPI